jgi:F-box-like
MTFDMLSDDVLLGIFDFYVPVDEDMGEDFEQQKVEDWITLAHVCRRWRSVVFQSPRRLNLRLVCTTHKTPTLNIWPPFPLIIRDIDNIFGDGSSSVDNIIAALEHNDRVCQIQLSSFSSSGLGYVTDSAAMHKPFPELTDLRLHPFVGPGPILSDSFLGGTTPRLQLLYLYDLPFPGLPKLLLSATHLVKLDLSFIPLSGYIPPEVMATSLSALTSLEFLRLQFRYPRPRPALGSRRLPPPPLTRSILPSLTEIQFKGASEYLEDILARIDAPRLNELHITFFNQITFDTPQLFQFISRRQTLRAPEKGKVKFSSMAIIVEFPSQTSDYDVLSVEISCTASEWQLSSLEQVCTSSLPPVSTLEDLYIFEDRKNPPCWPDDVGNTLWLELLHSFAAVKNLYLCEKIARRIAPALQELVGAITTEVLPTLENIFLEGLQPSGPLQEGIKKFVAARQLTGHPAAVSRWDMDAWYFSNIVTVS